MSATAKRFTIDEFLAHPAGFERNELVRGEVREMTPTSGGHGLVATNFVWLLSSHVRERALGWVFGDNVGYTLPNLIDTVRAPDASFVRADRLRSQDIGAGFLRLAPDLAVEVLSPTDTASELEEKLADYRAARIPLVWVTDPARRRISVHALDAPVRRLREGDVLDGGVVLPGFSCPVDAAFEGLAR